MPEEVKEWIIKEYYLILEKKSKESRKRRDEIVKLVKLKGWDKKK